MNTTTLTLTISHEGELPHGLLAALEAKAYDFTMAHGVACGEVVAKVKPLIDMPVIDMKPSDEPWPLPARPFRYSLDGSPIKVNHE